MIKSLKLKDNEARFMLTAIVFIIILGLLIFVHELGHFALARKNGIRAYEFGFGFPPRILGVQLVRRIRMEKTLEKEEKAFADLEESEEREIVNEIIKGKARETRVAREEKKWQLLWGKKKNEVEDEGEDNEKDNFHGEIKKGTIYSLNWIPLGGFVRIKGEDGGHENEPDSFAGKSAWVRIKVLAAGVIMNFLLAWFLFSLSAMIGTPEVVDATNKKIVGSKIQISALIPDAPAAKMGIKVGDEIIGCKGEDENCQKNFSEIKDFQHYVLANKGREIILVIKRGSEMLELKGVPRENYPPEQGSLGIEMVRTAIVKYPWYEAIVKGFTTTVNITAAIFSIIFDALKGLFTGQKVQLDVSGPVGIVKYTDQVAAMGFVYILNFAALLSVNLAIINGFPFPALDGGRILFILAEKIKGRPISRRIENFAHTVGFAFLIALMIAVTLRDLFKFEFINRIGNVF